MTSRPHALILFVVATLIGSVCALALIWMFGIEISAYDRFVHFPDGWTFVELAWNATAALLLFGCIRGVYVALRAHYVGDTDAPGPGTGGG